MPPGSRSLFLSADHLVVVAVTIALNLWVCIRAWRRPEALWTARFRKGLAAVLLLNVIFTHVWLLASGRWDKTWSLNFQLCDAATAACIVALLSSSPLAFELAYFWGLGAALQGLITPTVVDPFPDPIFIQFFVLHAGLVTTGLFLAFGMRMRPRRGAVVRMMLWTNGFAVVAAIASVLTGGNYMFLRKPPGTGSLLGMLGPWPWYILWAEIVAAVVFALLLVPFVFAGRRDKVAHSRSSTSP